MSFEQIMAMIMGNRGPAKKPVGVVPVELMPELDAHFQNRDRVRDAITEAGKAKIEAFIAQIEAEGQASPEWQEVIAEGDALWTKVYDAVGLPADQRDRNHVVDKDDGILYEIEKEEEDDQEPEEEEVIIPSRTRHNIVD
jgi:hypothetical protein